MSANTNATILARLHRQIQEAEDLLRRLERRKDELKSKQENTSRLFSERLRQANGTAEIRLLTQEMNETIREFLNELSLINNDIRQVEYSIRTFKQECDRLF